MEEEIEEARAELREVLWDGEIEGTEGGEFIEGGFGGARVARGGGAAHGVVEGAVGGGAAGGGAAGLVVVTFGGARAHSDHSCFDYIRGEWGGFFHSPGLYRLT